jgi:hypothetical protein
MIAFGAVLLWIGTPYALRFVLTAPVFVDELATGLSTVWLAVFFARTTQIQWFLAPLLAVFATLAREVGVATVTITCVTAVIVGIVPLRYAVVNCAVAAAAFAFDLSQPHTTHSANSPSMAWEVFLKWVHHPHMALSAILMGTGLAIFALVPSSLRRTLRAVTDARYVSALVPTAVALVVSSPFLGRELPRFSSGATPILCLLLALYLVSVADILRIALLTTAAIVFLHEWKIFGVVQRSQPGYLNYFYGRTVFHLPAILLLAAIATVLFIVDIPASPPKPRLHRRAVPNGNLPGHVGVDLSADE